MYKNINSFTKREKEVTQLLLEGKSNKQIALSLGVSESTIEYHLKNIYKKLQVNSRTEAVLHLGKSVGKDISNELWKSTVEINEESAENGKKSISTQRFPMKKTFYAVGGSLLGIALVAIILLVNSSTQNTTVFSTSTELIQTNIPLPIEAKTISEIEELAGFDVKEPTYLPQGVFLNYASYQKSPTSRVTLYFKLVHENYGDMGNFFQISQEPQTEPIPNQNVCGATSNECELIPINENVIVYYQFTSPTESLTWNMDGFTFILTRTAGEPNKTYKDELLKVVESMKTLFTNPFIVTEASEIAQIILKESFAYTEPLQVILEGEMSYGEFGELVHEIINRPPDLRIWVTIYFNEMWQYKPAVSDLSQFPLFRGCVSVAINLVDGQPIQASVVSNGIFSECDSNN